VFRKNNNLNRFSENKELKKDGMIMKRKYEKRDAVSFILLINKIQILAASYYNGIIILWDTLLMEQRKIYKDHKTVRILNYKYFKKYYELNIFKLKGVYQMVYDNTKNLLFSCGFDHNIYVYDPYISFHVYKLGGHYGSINKLVCNEKENELISMDIFGNIKIWDTQMLVSFQTISVSENSESNSRSTNLKLLYLKKQKKIMIYGSKFMFFETDKSLNPELADDQIIFSSYYDKFSKSLLSFSLRKIKLWNPFTGKIRKVYDDPMKNEITALALDKNIKRNFLGDNLGNIKCFNMKNGKFLKNFTSHDTEINILSHSLKLSVLVSCSVDNIIKIHKDADILDTNMLKELTLSNNQVKSILIMEDHSRIIIGLSNGCIKFYDIEHYRYDSDLNSDSNVFNDELTCMYYFLNKSVMISSHSSGLNKFLICPPHPFKFFSNYEFYNVDYKDKNNNIPVTCFDYDEATLRLFCGDQLGFISCYSLKEYFDFIDNHGININSKKLLSINIIYYIFV